MRRPSNLAPTPRDVVLADGSARLVRFRRPGVTARPVGVPVLLVPSLINRWYVLDLRPGVSLVAAMLDAGLDVFCLDWGAPAAEDRYLSWDAVLARLSRAARRVRRMTGSPSAAVLGYCMGATLTAIHAALEPERTAALVNLAGPVDFSHAGLLGRLTDRRWFDPGAVADAGNVRPSQMQAGFVALRPTLQVKKWVGLMDRGHDPAFREAFGALETWASDNIPFPGEAYRTYVRELYQDNALVRGTHHVAGRRVDLSAIRCPVLTITAERDTICPPPAATALNEHVSSPDREHLSVPGGHVGAVVGSRAPRTLYPAIASWLKRRVGSPAAPC